MSITDYINKPKLLRYYRQVTKSDDLDSQIALSAYLNKVEEMLSDAGLELDEWISKK